MSFFESGCNRTEQYDQRMIFCLLFFVLLCTEAVLIERTQANALRLFLNGIGCTPSLSSFCPAAVKSLDNTYNCAVGQSGTVGCDGSGNVVYLSLSNINLVGTFATQIGLLSNLDTIYLDSNKLTGLQILLFWFFFSIERIKIM